jgi:hypothetical protein
MATSTSAAAAAKNERGSRLVTMERVRATLYALMFITIGLLLYNPFAIHISTRGALIFVALLIVGQILIDRQNRLAAQLAVTTTTTAPATDERLRRAAPEQPAPGSKIVK